jgi:hypothetical protein
MASASRTAGPGASLLSQSLILPGPNLVASGSVRSHIDNDAQYECDNPGASSDPETVEDCRTRRFSIDFACASTTAIAARASGRC